MEADNATHRAGALPAFASPSGLQAETLWQHMECRIDRGTPVRKNSCDPGFSDAPGLEILACALDAFKGKRKSRAYFPDATKPDGAGPVVWYDPATVGGAQAPRTIVTRPLGSQTNRARIST